MNICLNHSKSFQAKLEKRV